MTINIQATRESTAETAPGRADYEEKDARRRRFVPLIFLLIVGSCSAYLKSFLPVKLVEASESREPPRGSAREEETVREEVLAAGDDPDPEQPAARSSGRTEEVRIMARGDEPLASSGETDFSAPARTDKPEVETGFGESPKVANDNRPPPHQEAPGRGGGGRLSLATFGLSP
ncbi:hypothetical protein IVA85_31280, partial [Bradyrhizobium sp. 145]|nr:hypothetical protein [Bradyrhizobium sp. 145]